MKWTLGLLCALVSPLAAGCGGGSSSPAAPSRPSPALSSGTSAIAIGQPATSSLFGISSADLASCLHGSADPACFSGVRLSARAVGAAATAPGAPLNLSATASGGTVTLTWTAPVSGDPVTTYVIEAGSSSGASNLANLVTNSTATTFSASGVGPGTYYVRVRAQNAEGVSGPSNEWILIVGTSACTSAPNAPTGVMGTSVASTVTITWVAPAGGCAPTSYVLQAGSSPGASDLANFNTGSSATTFVAPNVGNGTYYLRVLAQNAFGRSAASSEWTLVVGTTTPTVVDVNPKSQDFGPHGGCDAAILSQRFDITAPTDVRWEAFVDGEGEGIRIFEIFRQLVGNLDRWSGTGVGSVTYTLTIPKGTPRLRFTCSDFFLTPWYHDFDFDFYRGDQLIAHVRTKVTYTYKALW